MNWKRIGSNIRSLRERHRQTPLDLALIIKVSTTRLNEYENGDRIALDKLQIIADYYDVTIESLINDDIDNTPIQAELWDAETIKSLIDNTLPLLTSDSARQNEHFAKGYQYVMNCKSKLREGYTLPAHAIDPAFDAFVYAFEHDGIIEAAGNLLFFFFILYSSKLDPHYDRLGQAILHGKTKSKDFLKKYMVKNPNENDDKNSEERAILSSDITPIVYQIIRLLREDGRYYAFAEYYLALGHFFGIFDNGNNADKNKTIGFGMVCSASALGNNYASAFLNTIS